MIHIPSLLSNFQATVSSGDLQGLSAFQAVITGPDADDKSKATNLMDSITTLESIWSQSQEEIQGMSDAEKHKVYTSSAYKEAYATYKYLKETVKAVMIKVSNGDTITLEEFNNISKSDKANSLRGTKKTNQQ